ncbi:hypothetical protein PINS_up010708 [Pythium insidiosum]|nr:hypothetical protein PINS_up010708 [Pythium insidiosum]
MKLQAIIALLASGLAVTSASSCTLPGQPCTDINGKPSRCMFSKQNGVIMEACVPAPAPCPATATGLEPCGGGRVCAPFNGMKGFWCMDPDFYSTTQILDRCFQKPDNSPCSIFRLRSDAAGTFALYELTSTKCLANQCIQARYSVCEGHKVGDACAFREVDTGGAILSLVGSCAAATPGSLPECIPTASKQDGIAPKAISWPESLDLRNVTMTPVNETAAPVPTATNQSSPTPVSTSSAGSQGLTDPVTTPSPVIATPFPAADVKPKGATPSVTPKSAAPRHAVAGVAALVAGTAVAMSSMV